MLNKEYDHTLNCYSFKRELCLFHKKNKKKRYNMKCVKSLDWWNIVIDITQYLLSFLISQKKMRDQNLLITYIEIDSYHIYFQTNLASFKKVKNIEN